MRLKAAAAIAGLGLLAAACSGGSKGSAGGGTGFSIQAVASSTIAARTAHVDGTLSGTDHSKPVHGTFSGDADFAHDASSVKFEMSGKDGGTLEIIVARGNTYIRGPEAVFAGKYTELPENLFGGNGSGTPLGLSTLGWGVADPVRALQQLRGLATRVVEVGHETVRGTAATHVRMTVPVGALFGCPKHATPTSEGLGSSNTSDPVFCDAQVKVRPATIDVWVDDTSRMIRLETKIESGPATSMDSRLDYSGFGEHVDISPPPKSQVLDMASLVTASSDIGKHVAVTGPWQPVASGKTAGVAWSLATAPAKTAVCLDFETSKAAPQRAATVPLGPTVSRGSRGAVPCLDPSLIGGQEVVIVSSTRADALFGAVVGLADSSVHSLAAHFADGTTVPIAIDPKTHTFVWVGAPKPTLSTLTAESAQGPITCYSDPTTVFGAMPTPQPTVSVPVPVPDLFGFSCVPNSELQMMKQQLKTMPSLPSSVTLTAP
jgi:hypothetical protein